MDHTEFTAVATTCSIDPGTETTEAGMVRIRQRVFTDTVESDEPRLAGVNKPVLDLDLDPSTGGGSLEGSFVLTPEAVDGTWEGNLSGKLEGGMVRALGHASGTGALAGSRLHVEFQQIGEHPAEPPCDDPQAFFRMWGHIEPMSGSHHEHQ